MIVEEIKQAKLKSNKLSSHLSCCNVFWIGPRPLTSVHIFNEQFRCYLDKRNRSKYCLDPKSIQSDFEDSDMMQTEALPVFEGVSMENQQDVPLFIPELSMEPSMLMDSKGRMNEESTTYGTTAFGDEDYYSEMGDLNPNNDTRDNDFYLG